MKPRVYIDGREGTTGLQIWDRLSGREDVELLRIDEDRRKDPEARREMIHAADLVFLCLPDQAAREAVSLAEGAQARIIDASTAHRTAPGWDYGFAELSRGHRNRIAASRRVANPGCHATGFISIVYPLVQQGLLSPGQLLSCYSLTGYSGGGKQLIAEYEDGNRDPRHRSHRIYGLNLNHKHLPEMQAVCGLEQEPLFSPVLGDFPQGMATTVFLPELSAQQVHLWLSAHYREEKLVQVAPLGGEEPMIYASTMAGRDSLRLIVCGREDRCTVTALFDNLGKGASGAAVQNMNLMLGFDETAGLSV